MPERPGAGRYCAAVQLRRLTAALVGFVGLTLEIAYTRVVSFKLFYYYTYFVIGLALLGFGVAASIVALSRRLRDRDVLDVVRVAAPLVSITGIAAFVGLSLVPTDVNQIWVGTLGRGAVELGVVVLLALLITLAFLGLGIIISLLIVRDAADVRSLYFWDLIGAALGCLLAVPLQATLGPPVMVIGSLVLFAALAPLIAIRRGEGVPLAFGACALAALVGIGAGFVDVRADATKTITPDSDVVAGDWGAVFRVDVTPGIGHQILHHDGLWGSTIWEYDGTPRTTDRFLTDDRQFPWAVLGRAPERLLIIGAAGGNEIQAALTYGVGHVDAVELNPVTHRLLTDDFAEYSGNIANHPDVDYIQGDGRTFLARSDDEYDMVWFVAPDSYAASNSATSGAFVLSESYLYTEEMIEEAFDHLTDDGMMVAQFGDFDFETRPTRTARYLATARAALGERLEPFGDHVVLTAESSDLELTRISTIVLSPTAIDAAALSRLDEVIPSVAGARIVSAPGREPEPGLPGALIAADAAGAVQLVDDYAFDISAIDDDRPFFWHFTPYSDVITDFSRGLEDSEVAIGERLILMLLVVSALVALALLAIPFLWSRSTATPVPGRWRLFAYFAALGFGFFVIEIAMIQRFALLLGYPTLSLSVSLFTLLLATALGARWSTWVQGDVGRRMLLVLAALWLVTLTYLAVSGPITDAVLAWSSPLRIALVFVLLFPVGVLLGMFLPTGIDLARELSAAAGADEGRIVAWCWAVNGFFSVIGSTSTTILSMTFGFDRTIIVGLVLYTVAAFAVRVPVGSNELTSGNPPAPMSRSIPMSEPSAR
jgi:hypothetical protein